MKVAESSSNGWKTLREKEKLLVTSNFSFSHSVFKRLILQTCKNQGLFVKGLKQIKLLSLNALNLDKSEILSCNKGLNTGNQCLIQSFALPS